MSFILDALRKSEEERLRERSPDFLREPVVTPPAPIPRWPGRAIAVGIVVLAIGVWLAWTRPWHPAPERALSGSPASAPTGAAPAVPQVEPSPRAEALRELQQAMPPVRAEPAGSMGEPSNPPRVQAAPSPGGTVTPRVVEPPSVPAPVTRKPPASPPKSAEADEKPLKSPAREIPPPPDRVLHISELPPALKEGLPNLAVRGFVYSDDSASRMVVINDRMLQEGDEIGSDLKLERIDPEGAVLNYKGYRFFAPR